MGSLFSEIRDIDGCTVGGGEIRFLRFPNRIIRRLESIELSGISCALIHLAQECGRSLRRSNVAVSWDHGLQEALVVENSLLPLDLSQAEKRPQERTQKDLLKESVIPKNPELRTPKTLRV